MARLLEFIKRRYLLIIGFLILVVCIGGYFLWPFVSGFFNKNGTVQGTNIQKVDSPSIINGELVLPKVYSGGVIDSKSKIRVVSAFLVGVFEEKQQQQQTNPFAGAAPSEPPKLVGIRVLGELTNSSNEFVKEFSPVVKFYNDKDKLIAQKIAKVAPGFDFYGVGAGGTTVYDILLEDPPKADKLEILFNAAKSEKKPSSETLKITDSAIEVKTAKYQKEGEATVTKETVESSESGDATNSAEIIASSSSKSVEVEKSETVEYYTLSGSFQNSLVDSVSDVTVYAWVKNKEGQVFSLARQDYKGDLIAPKKKVNFKINLLPFKIDEKMDSYGVTVFAKRYTLN